MTRPRGASRALGVYLRSGNLRPGDGGIVSIGRIVGKGAPHSQERSLFALSDPIAIGLFGNALAATDTHGARRPAFGSHLVKERHTKSVRVTPFSDAEGTAPDRRRSRLFRSRREGFAGARAASGDP